MSNRSKQINIKMWRSLCQPILVTYYSNLLTNEWWKKPILQCTLTYPMICLENLVGIYFSLTISSFHKKISLILDPLPGIIRAINPRNFLKLASPRMRGRNSKSLSLNSLRISSIGMMSFFSLWRPIMRNFNKSICLLKIPFFFILIL